MPHTEFFAQLLNGLEEAGWIMAVRDVPDNEFVEGLIIGTPEYVNSLLALIPDDYAVASPPKDGH